MLLQAARDFNIDLERSWMVGDGENDVLAGKNAGCHTALLKESVIAESESNSSNFGADFTAATLKDAIREILQR